MYEAYEELLELWWFKHYATGKSNDLFKFMCVDRVESKFLPPFTHKGKLKRCAAAWLCQSVSAMAI